MGRYVRASRYACGSNFPRCRPRPAIKKVLELSLATFLRVGKELAVQRGTGRAAGGTAGRTVRGGMRYGAVWGSVWRYGGAVAVRGGSSFPRRGGPAAENIANIWKRLQAHQSPAVEAGKTCLGDVSAG